MTAESEKVVIDTSVLVAAAFRPRSDSGRAVDAVREGVLRLIWDENTRAETERIFRKIPPISWESISTLFQEVDRHRAGTDPSAFTHVPDPDDRKFAALAAAADAVLLTLDEHLLGATDARDYVARTPSQFLGRR